MPLVSRKIIMGATGGLILALLVMLIFGPWPLRPEGIRFARAVSDLTLPRSAKLLTYQTNWGAFGGSGHAIAIVSVEPTDWLDLESQAAEKGYATISASSGSMLPTVTGLPNAKAGMYRLTKAHADQYEDLAILDRTNHKLLVYSAR